MFDSIRPQNEIKTGLAELKDAQPIELRPEDLGRDVYNPEVQTGQEMNLENSNVALMPEVRAAEVKIETSQNQKEQNQEATDQVASGAGSMVVGDTSEQPMATSVIDMPEAKKKDDFAKRAQHELEKAYHFSDQAKVEDYNKLFQTIDEARKSLNRN